MGFNLVEIIEFIESADHCGVSAEPDWFRFHMWCLGQNLETAAALACMRHFGWTEGFATGSTIKGLCDGREGVECTSE